MTMAFSTAVRKVVPYYIVAADGTGDYDTIQVAINALPSGGGTVFVKEGTYTITATIDVTKSNTSLIGAGSASIISTTSDITMLKTDNVDNIIVDSLKFDGSGESVNYGVQFNRTSYSLIQNCYFVGCGNYPIYLTAKYGIGSYYNIIRRNRLDNNESSITITGTWSTSKNQWNVITENLINDCDEAVLVDAHNTRVINNNISNSSGGVGITIIGDENILEGNNLSLSNQDGVDIIGSRNVVSGNTVLDSGSTSAHDGIDVNGDSDNNSIINNIFKGSYGYGINIKDVTCDNNVVAGNVCVNNTEGQINDSGTGTQIGHNITS